MATTYTTRPSILNLVRTLAPGPSPRSAQSLYPTVLRVPVSDYQEFKTHVVSRYEDSVKRGWPKAMLEAAKTPCPRPIDDAELASLFWHSAFAIMMTREIDDEAATRFAPLLDAEPDARWVVLDLTAMRNLQGEMLPGLHSTPSRTLLEERDGGDPILRAIELEGLLLRPEDGAAWELAKLFVRQGAMHAIIMGAHPLEHFPYDTVNGVTRRSLPANHALRRLLEPHFYIHLSLNFGVLYSDRSVARNNQKEIYAPFACSERGQFALLRAGWKGVEGSARWKPYRYPLSERGTVGPYGDFCRHYYAVVERHVDRALAQVDPADPHVLRWADEIAMHLPGFPSAIRIIQPGMLQRAVASAIAGVSILHTGEHYTASALPISTMPLRLRVAPPTNRRHSGFRHEELTTRRDMFRQYMAREMFMKVHPVRRLKDVRYHFAEPELGGVGDAFRDELAEASRTLPGREYVPLEMFACSLQY